MIRINATGRLMFVFMTLHRLFCVFIESVHLSGLKRNAALLNVGVLGDEQRYLETHDVLPPVIFFFFSWEEQF